MSYNSHLLQLKHIFYSERPEDMYANPIQARLKKLGAKELTLFANSMFEAMLHGYMPNYLESVLLEQVASTNYSEQLEQVSKQGFTNPALILNFNQDVRVAFLDIITIIGQLGFTESTEEIVNEYVDQLSEYLTTDDILLDYYQANSNFSNAELITRLDKLSHDFLNLFVRYLQAFLQQETNELLEICQLASLYNLYLIRNFYEFDCKEYVTNEQIAKFVAFTIELDRQWENYRILEAQVTSRQPRKSGKQPTASRKKVHKPKPQQVYQHLWEKLYRDNQKFHELAGL